MRRRAAAKVAAREARTIVDEALVELQLLTDDPRVLELAARVVDLHDAPERAECDCQVPRSESPATYWIPER
ncbi:hypothetical protein [Streptomyces sp. NPDC055210]